MERLDVHALAFDVVRGLSNVHPVAWQLHLVELLLRGHRRENFSLDRRRSVLNAVDDFQVEQVQTRVDLVANEDSWLLNEAFNLAILFGDDDTVSSGVLHLRDYDSSLVAVALVEGDELIERVLADHV